MIDMFAPSRSLTGSSGFRRDTNSPADEGIDMSKIEFDVLRDNGKTFLMVEHEASAEFDLFDAGANHVASWNANDPEIPVNLDGAEKVRFAEWPGWAVELLHHARTIPGAVCYPSDEAMGVGNE